MRMFFCVLVLVLTIGVANVFASMVRAMTFEEMREVSTSLVRAEVIEKEPLFVTFLQQDEHGNKFEVENIWTKYVVRITDILYGDVKYSERSSRTVDVFIPGGEVGGERRWVSSAFGFEVGWDVVIHLLHDELNNVYYSAGTSQAVFLAREIDDQEVFVNLSDYQQLPLNREALSNIREKVYSDDWVRPQNPSLISYQALQSIAGELP